MSAGRCEACQADIFWARLPSGKRMPLDPARRDDGNVAVYRDHLGGLRARVLKAGERPDTHEWLALPHFATCKHADRFRKGPDGVPRNVVPLRRRPAAPGSTRPR